MQITLQELVEISDQYFNGVSKDNLWIFYCEETGEFFFIENYSTPLSPAFPPHNNLGYIIKQCRETYPETFPKQIRVYWQEPRIHFENN